MNLSFETCKLVYFDVGTFYHGMERLMKNESLNPSQDTDDEKDLTVRALVQSVQDSCTKSPEH